MFQKKPTAIFRSLIRDAFWITWQRKSLWVFGIFAAFISTGGVLDVATTGLSRIKSNTDFFAQMFKSSFVGFALFGQYIRQFATIGSFWTTILFLCTILVAIGLILLAVLSQASLIHGIKSPSHLHPRLIRKEASVHILSLFTIDLITKIGSALLITISTLPVWWFYAQSSSLSLFVVFIQLLIFFPAILILNILALLSIIHIIETGVSVSQAIHVAWNIFKKHWLASFEFAVILFFLISLSGLLLLGIGIILSVPFAILYSTTLLSGSLALFFIANIIFGLFALLIVLFFGGSVVTFQYAAWYLFYKQTGLEIHIKNSLSKILRVFQR